MSSEFTPEMLRTLKERVFSAAKDGMAISIFAMLWNLDRNIVEEVLDHMTEEDGQKTTPLIIAARNGEEKVVQVFLTNFSVNIEQTGTVRFDGYVIEGATPLWCAAGAGHFPIVKLLVEHGANVNHPTYTNSTPLRAACFDGRLDIVKYLVEHQADLSIANKYRNTCLMISCYKGRRDVVVYLLEKGADPDCRAYCGATALHFSSECGHLQIVKELIRFGASLLSNDNNMTPLTVAAECGKSDVVEYFISLPQCTREEKINTLELLGASYANDKDNYNIGKTYYYLKRGMEERYIDLNNIIKKPNYPPVTAYNKHVEFQTMAELQAAKRDYDSLHMEALTIRERILGADNSEIPHPVIFRGAVFADLAQFNKCIILWMHAMRLRQKNNRSIAKDLLRFSQVFAQMVHLGVILDFCHVEEVLQHAILEMERDSQRILKDEDKDGMVEIYQANIHTILYLLVIALNINKGLKDNCEILSSYVYKFLQLKPKLKNGYTPLHMAVDSATLVDDFHVNDVVLFPHALLASFFVKCGADVNIMDNMRNTPLHIIVRYTKPISDFDTLHHIMMTLIKNDAHLDICNSECKTPMECTTTGVAEVILRTNNQISLKCVAAKAIKKYNVPYMNLVPAFLADFVHIH